jgi:hypothetical protein
MKRPTHTTVCYARKLRVIERRRTAWHVAAWIGGIAAWIYVACFFAR